jgi:hypothetical protein
MTFSETKMNVNDMNVLIPTCHLTFGLHNILGKTDILNNLNAILIRNQKKKLSIDRKYPSILHVASNVEDGSPIHCVHFKPTTRDPHKSIKGLQVQLIAQVAFDCILFGKSSLTNSYT